MCRDTSVSYDECGLLHEALVHDTLVDRGRSVLGVSCHAVDGHWRHREHIRDAVDVVLRAGGVGSAGWSRENEFLGAEFVTVLSETEISNKKLAAGLLGVFFGSLGVHKFVLGYKNAGIILLVVSLAGGVVTSGVATGVVQ